MQKKIRSVLVAILSISAITTASSVSPVRAALTYPSAQTGFSECSSLTQEFCVETLEFTPSGGSKTTIANPVPDLSSVGGRTDVYLSAFLSGSYAGPSSVTAMPAGLSINFYHATGTGFIPGVSPTTLNGIPDGLYRVVIRTGDFDPSMMLLTGKYDSLSITKGADGYFTIDLSLRPTPIARVVNMNNDESALTQCRTVQWLAGCEANLSFRNWALASFAMLPQADLREAARGTWIMSNASVLNLSPAGLLQGNLDVDVQGPHYVPVDFGVPGLTVENGREVNPAYFEMYVPYTMLAQAMSTKAGRTITVDQIKAYLEKPTEVVEGTIKEAASATSAAVEKVQTLGLTKGESGMRVNFNIAHYSAPNPSLKVKAPPSTATISTPSTGTPSTATPESTLTSKKLKNGATVLIATTATKGKTVSGKALFSPSSGAKVTKIVTKTKKICTVKGTSVKMLKAGTCKVIATVTYKKKTSTASATLSVT